MARREGAAHRSRGGATGGSVSILYDRPGWQDVSITSLNKNSRDGRVVPDITALAGPPMYDLVFRRIRIPSAAEPAPRRRYWRR